MDECCETCRFFWQRKFTGNYCRRFPPNAAGDPLQADVRQTRWPAVAYDDWCGEWRAHSASDSPK